MIFEQILITYSFERLTTIKSSEYNTFAHTTINLGTEGQNLTLRANGTEGSQAYQINASGSYVMM